MKTNHDISLIIKHMQKYPLFASAIVIVVRISRHSN